MDSTSRGNAPDALTSLVRELKSVSKVPVYVDMPEGAGTDESRDSIVINRVKMLDLIDAHVFVHTCVHRAWSNLPDPPTDSKTNLFVWMLSAENYCINNYTISWESATPSTFVHMWSIVDRMRGSFENMSLSWVIGDRNCVGYSETMGMTGPIDAHMYVRESVHSTSVLTAIKESGQFTLTNTGCEFSSYYEMHVSMMMPRMPEMVDVIAMIAKGDDA